MSRGKARPQRGKRGGLAIHGVLAVDKPEGLSSFAMVDRVRRLLGAAKAGHAGTLDPFATGLLVVLLGEATKLAPFLMAATKVYRATARLGVSTDTLDLSGKIVGQSPVPDFDRAQIEAALGTLKGPRAQAPPAFSAAKHQGQPLYRLARRGITVAKAAKRVEVYDVELESWRRPDVTFMVTVSAGTYIRILGADLGDILGCGAHLTGLRRLKSGQHDVADAVSQKELDDLTGAGTLAPKITSLNQGLSGMPAIVLDGQAAVRLRQGRLPDEADLDRQTGTYGRTRAGDGSDASQWRVFTPPDDLVAVIQADPTDYKIIRVFNPTTNPDAEKKGRDDS